MQDDEETGSSSASESSSIFNDEESRSYLAGESSSISDDSDDSYLEPTIDLSLASGPSLHRFESFAQGINDGDCSSPVGTRRANHTPYETGRLLLPRDGLDGVLPPLYPEERHSHVITGREVSIPRL